MDLQRRIKQDLVLSMKGRRQFQTRVLRMLQAVIINKQKDKKYKMKKQRPGLSDEELEIEGKLTENELLDLILLEVKRREESVLVFKKGKRKDLVEEEEKEINILKRYLPEQLSENNVNELVKEAIIKTGAKTIKDMGKVMAVLKPQIRGRADGGRVSKIVKGLLS